MDKNAQKILVFGSLTVDLFARPKDSSVISHITENNRKDFLAFPHGGKITADQIEECFGGGGANVGLTFAKHGFSTSVAGAIGNDTFAPRILKNLEDNNINLSAIQEISDKKSGFSIILNSFDGERTVIFTSGANAYFSEVREEAFDGVTGIYLCHLSTSFPSSVREKIAHHLETFPETFFAWNPGKEVLEKGISKARYLLSFTNILFLNREEAEIFCEMQSQRKESYGERLRKSEQYCSYVPENNIPDYAYNVSDIAKKLLSTGVQTVVITDGRRGSQIFHQGSPEFYFCPIDEREERVDTLGAGDAFSSAFCSAKILGKDLPTCAKYATIAASSVVSHLGAQTGILGRVAIEEKLLSSSFFPQKISLPSF
jgi:ribokinase